MGANITATTLFRDKNGELRTGAFLTAHPELRKSSYQDVNGNYMDWQSYLALPDDMRRYAEGGWAMTPQIAMLAENGPEPIIPLSNPQAMSQLRKGLGLEGGGGNNYTFYIDGSRDVDLVMAEITKRLRQTTGVKF